MKICQGKKFKKSRKEEKKKKKEEKRTIEKMINDANQNFKKRIKQR